MERRFERSHVLTDFLKAELQTQRDVLASIQDILKENTLNRSLQSSSIEVQEANGKRATVPISVLISAAMNVFATAASSFAFGYSLDIQEWPIMTSETS